MGAPSSPLGALALAALRAGSLALRDGTSGQSQTASKIALRAAPTAGEGREISQFTAKSKAVGRAQTQGGTWWRPHWPNAMPTSGLMSLAAAADVKTRLDFASTRAHAK